MASTYTKHENISGIGKMGRDKSAADSTKLYRSGYTVDPYFWTMSVDVCSKTSPTTCEDHKLVNGGWHSGVHSNRMYDKAAPEIMSYGNMGEMVLTKANDSHNTKNGLLDGASKHVVTDERTVHMHGVMDAMCRRTNHASRHDMVYRSALGTSTPGVAGDHDHRVNSHNRHMVDKSNWKDPCGNVGTASTDPVGVENVMTIHG